MLIAINTVSALDYRLPLFPPLCGRNSLYCTLSKVNGITQGLTFIPWQAKDRRQAVALQSAPVDGTREPQDKEMDVSSTIEQRQVFLRLGFRRRSETPPPRVVRCIIRYLNQLATVPCGLQLSTGPTISQVYASAFKLTPPAGRLGPIVARLVTNQSPTAGTHFPALGRRTRRGKSQAALRTRGATLPVWSRAFLPVLGKLLGAQ